METFGKIPASTALLLLYSGSDPSVPPFVNKDDLVNRWVAAVQEGGGNVDKINGGIVPDSLRN